jgi:hypothetical protein
MKGLRILYRSSSGDQWSLLRDIETGGVSIMHEPNAASGGKTSFLSVREFLMQGDHGPEHQELLRLIGTLVE